MVPDIFKLEGGLLLGGIEDGLRKCALPLNRQHDLPVPIFDLFHQDRLGLSVGHVAARLLLSPHFSRLGHGRPAEAVVASDGPVGAMRPIASHEIIVAAHDVWCSQLRGHGEDGVGGGRATANRDGPPQIIVQGLALAVAEGACAGVSTGVEQRLRLACAGLWAVIAYS